jgi:hypothetical protein
MRASSERSAAGAAGNHKEFPQFYSGHFTLNIPSESSQRRVNPGYRTLKSHAHRITNGSNRCIAAGAPKTFTGGNGHARDRRLSEFAAGKRPYKS